MDQNIVLRMPNQQCYVTTTHRHTHTSFMCVKFNAEEQNKLGMKGTHTTCVHSYQAKKNGQIYLLL